MTQSECPWGHPYSGQNRGTSTRNGAAFCRRCRSVMSRGSRMGASLALTYGMYPEWRDLAIPLPRRKKS